MTSDAFVPLETLFCPHARDTATRVSAMPPPLPLDKHPLCREAVIALKRCPAANALGKFLGKCNEEKWTLDACLKEQKLWKSRRNLKLARESKARLAKKLEEERAK